MVGAGAVVPAGAMGTRIGMPIGAILGAIGITGGAGTTGIVGNRTFRLGGGGRKRPPCRADSNSLTPTDWKIRRGTVRLTP